MPLVWSRGGGIIKASLISGGVYDFDTGIMLTTRLMKTSPELLSLGVILGNSYDYLAGEKMSKLFNEGRANKEWWQPGFNLYDTNIKFPETSSSKAPNTGMKYFFAASLALLVLTAFLNRRWRRE
ncbi:hypothetical protein [Thermococcus sp. MV11]|uniref:hypothetical protein n=1 Tax=Thermococcus sp. MV11 TaxID=1638267 RepID=UPI001F11587F|nr:hypothetical protein [Thermococcus sp. MV11]